MDRLARLPKFWMALAALAGLLLGRALPVAIPAPLRWLGLVPLLAGLALLLAAGLRMRRAGTTVMPGHAPSRLVIGGAFGLTRNPIYLGDTLILTGLFVCSGSATGLLLVPAFLWLIDRHFIPQEEAALRAAFGPDFNAYARRVRRWL